MARVVTTAVQSSQVLAAARARRTEEKMNAFMLEDWDVDWDRLRICSQPLSSTQYAGSLTSVEPR